MIDENLMRAELSPAQRASGTARRKAIYVEMHPATAAGVFHGNQHASGLRQIGEHQPERFTAETASTTGRSERAVQRDAERGERIRPEALTAVSGTALDEDAYLDTSIGPGSAPKKDPPSRRAC